MTCWPYPARIAHRGGGTLAPENTLAAIRHGASLGFKGVEFDVMLAGDGIPVLMHDETLERTTSGRGEVSRTPYAEMAALDAGAWKGERWRGERVPSFEAAGSLCRDLGIWANAEIKPAKGFERDTGAAAARMARSLWRGADEPCLLSSFRIEALEAAQEAAPELPRGWIVRELPPDWRATMKRLGCISLHCKHQLLTPQQAAEVRAEGYALVCWTVNDADAARRLIAWGVDGIITDALDVIGPDFR
ncbi:MAG: glycerophosphodiester phosphodiesterase [Burkholderiales bacterium]